MNVLFLGPYTSPVINEMVLAGDTVRTCEREITVNSLEVQGVDFIVSHGYRHIIGSDVLDAFPRKVINLHISYLPWNRGADPNFWSFIDDTPKGVSIHYVDEGLDTGPIIAQRLISFWENETLKTSYDKLQTEIVRLFSEKWYEIKRGLCPAIPQFENQGSYHSKRDKIKMDFLLAAQGHDTPVSKLLEHKKNHMEDVPWASG